MTVIRNVDGAEVADVRALRPREKRIPHRLQRVKSVMILKRRTYIHPCAA